MASFLEGSLARSLDAGFRGTSLKGQLYRGVPDEDGGMNALGYANRVQGNIWDCRGFIDNTRDYFAGPTSRTIITVNIFSKSLEKGTVEPQKDDLAQFRGDWYQLGEIRTDPAKALWICEAMKTTIPDDLTSSDDTDMAVINTPRPNFRVKLASDFAVTAATVTKVAFDTVSHDIGSDYSIASRDYLVATAGIYRFASRLILSNDGDCEQVWIKIYKNGSAVSESEGFWFNDWESLRLAVSAEMTVECVIGDVVDVRIYAQGDAVTVLAGTAEFSGTFVGVAA